MLRKQVKEQEKEKRWLKADFFFQPALFLPPAVGSLQKVENDVPCYKNQGRRYQRKNLFLLPDVKSDTAGIL